MVERSELYELTRVRVLTFLREPEAVFWVLVFPLILAGVLGFAFRRAQAPASRVAVLKEASSAELRALLESVEDIELELVDSTSQARRLLERAAVDAIAVPAEGDGVPVLSFDPVRAEGQTARLRVLRAVVLGNQPDLDGALTLEPVGDTGTSYLDFLFPGLLGLNLMGTGMWGVGFAMADLRRRKLLKRLLVTPMRRSNFFLSFLLARAVFLILEVTVLSSIGAWLLGVPFRGDLVSFMVICLLGGFLFAGLGILVASRTRTIEGVTGLMNFVMVPMWLASGVFFSYERFPDALHPFLRLLPLTSLNDALRAVMLDGESLLSLGPELLVQVVWAFAAFFLALKIFRWE